MKNWPLLCLFLSSSALLLRAQSPEDALRYSRLMLGGTARSIGAGNAFGAVGADFSSAGSNPAGLGLYRASEFQFTAGIQTLNSEMSFEGDLFDAQRTRFVVPNVGFSIYAPLRGEKWRSVNFGFGMSRMADFNQRFSYQGSSTGSIAEMWLQNAQGTTPDNLNPFSEKLAYLGYILDNPDATTEYTSVLNAASRTFKEESAVSKGGINDLQFALATNYMDKLYLGFGINAAFLNYSNERSYAESDPDNTEPDFVSLDFREKLQTNGVGVNLKLGLLYRAARWFRFGVSLHTPTWYRLNDQYSSSLTTSAYYQAQLYEGTNDSPEGRFTYNLRTPLRALGSVVFLAKKVGFFSAEVEWADYGSAKFDFIENLNQADQQFLRELNQTVSSRYRSTVNARFGGELVLDIFRLRAGYGFYGSPFEKSYSAPEKDILHVFSAGAGLREDHFYLDLAYRHLFAKTAHIPYLVPNATNPTVLRNQLAGHLFMLTIGFRFG
jgi:long-subunit fatty acid transport protein